MNFRIAAVLFAFSAMARIEPQMAWYWQSLSMAARWAVIVYVIGDEMRHHYEFTTADDAEKAMNLCRTVASEAIRECARVIHNQGCYYEAGRLRAMAHNPQIHWGREEGVTGISERRRAPKE